MNFTSGVVVGILLALVVLYVIWPSLKRFLARNNYWSGSWYEIIPEQHGIPERIDLLRLTQIGHRVSGDAIRISPIAENKRTWYFEGFATENRIVGFFYLKSVAIDPASYIPTTLTRDKHPRTVSVWRGYYTWPAMSEDKEIIAGGAKTGIVVWQKHMPDSLIVSIETAN